MRKQWFMVLLAVLATAAVAHAGGPPPMYVIVDKVVMEPGTKTPGWVKIWGCMTRHERATEGKDNASERFLTPSYGYLFLSLDSKESDKVHAELADWRKAAGTGKAVAIGACGEGGSFLKCKWYSATDAPNQPDAVYTPGQLRLWGDLYATGQLTERAEVKALLKYAGQRKQ